MIFGGNSGTSKKKVTEAPKVTGHVAAHLVDYADTNVEVSMTVDGRVIANSQHQLYKITVSRDDVTYQRINGYDGQVVKTQIYANTEASYATFLKSIQKGAFSQGNNDPKGKDERGYCAQGQRYIFEIAKDGEDLMRYWDTSCGTPKTFLGMTGYIMQLFQAQVPNFDNVNTGFNG